MAGVPGPGVGRLPIERANPLLIGQIEDDVVSGALLRSVFGNDEPKVRR
jgi:hypothetical protein